MNELEQRIARLEDREAIRDLDARYCRALDDGDWDTLVSLFTADGEFVGLSRARGHAELRTFFAGLADAGLTAFWHHVTNLEITLEGPDSARARSFLWQPCVQDGVAHIAAGRYTDTVHRVDGAWRYVTKQVSFDYFVPLADGWDHGRFTVASAAATYPEVPRMSRGPVTELNHRVDGPHGATVLVLGPSLGTDLHLFDAQVAALADRYRIVRYDLPGHGGSPTPRGPYTVAGMARDLAALLERLGIERAHHAGVSLGGAIAQQLALDHPGRVLSLTAIASAARFADPDSWPQRAASVREHGTEVMVASRPGTWFVPAFAGTAEAERLLAMLRATTAEGYAGCCEAIATFDIRDRLSSLRMPVLAIAGAEDPATPPDMVQMIADRAQDGRFEVVADAAHLLNAEKPEQVNELLAEHLASVGAARS